MFSRANSRGRGADPGRARGRCGECLRWGCGDQAGCDPVTGALLALRARFATTRVLKSEVGAHEPVLGSHRLGGVPGAHVCPGRVQRLGPRILRVHLAGGARAVCVCVRRTGPTPSTASPSGIIIGV